MFTGYIIDIKYLKIANNVSEDEEGEEDIADEEFTFKTKAKRNTYKDRVLENVDKMDEILVFKLYHQLAYELKGKLVEREIAPDLMGRFNNQSQDFASQTLEAEKALLRPFIGKLIQFVHNGGFLDENRG